MNKRIIVSVTNDVASDQRVMKQCYSMTQAGFDLLLVGRKLPHSPEVDRPYRVHRFRLLFNRKALFYAAYNIRLFFLLFFSRVDVLYANDLDTLPANALVSLFRRKPLIYDSHEFFTEVPEIQSRRWVKAVWKISERLFIGRAEVVITVNDSIALLLKNAYGINEVLVVRNVPSRTYNAIVKSRAELSLPEHKRLLVIQGTGINVDRGGEELVQAMAFVPDAVLLIIGSGDALPRLRAMCASESLSQKVIFYPRMPYTDMMAITVCADLALSLDKPTNINYLYSLPNKLFDYIAAGVPVLASNLPEVARLITEYDIGRITQTFDPVALGADITSMLADSEALQKYRSNALLLSQKLSWDIEYQPVLDRLRRLT